MKLLMQRSKLTLKPPREFPVGCLVLLLLTVEVGAQSPVSYRFDTFAGTGEDGFGGDGGPATEAILDSPTGVTVDGAGNLYIADLENHRIRKVDAAGTITTVAGTGESGYGGDGGPATEARLDEPSGITVDGAGNLYIADTWNHRIRKVDAAGTITTVAGTGETGFGGDGGPVTGWYGFGGDGGPATEAILPYPYGVTVDEAGNLYIADGVNHRIRKVDAAGTITTVAGTGESGWWAGGFGGDGGPATEARLDTPTGVTVDGAGNLYIAGFQNHRIRKVDAAGTITTVAGTGEGGFGGDGGPATEARLTWPCRVTVDGAGNLYIADLGNHRIRKVDAAGTITTVAGTGIGDGWPATEAQLIWPYGVTVDGGGNLYIADTGYNRIRVLTPSVPLVLDGTGNIAGENIQHPNGNVFDQILFTGETIKLQARPNQITRVSFMDETEDIVQVEFSGAGSFTVTLDPATFLPPAIPPRYNQAVEYVTGKPSVVIDGADANTFFSIFTVGSINAVNQALFPEGQVYDAQADVTLVEVVNSTGMGGVQLSNTVFSGSTGKTGVDARGVPITIRLTLGDIDASGDAVPYLLFGEGSFTVPAGNPGLRITGGDLLQTNGASIVVAQSGSTTTGFETLISQNNFKSDNTPQPTLSIDATFANEDGDAITVATEELTIE